MDLGGFHIDAGILVDGMTSVMLMVVTTVSFFVHLYSTGYMHGDRRYERFFAFLGFFTFSMMGIILANNVFFLYVFWELVGLASYLLIGFFFPQAQRRQRQQEGLPDQPSRRLGLLAGHPGLLHGYGHAELLRAVRARARRHHQGHPADLRRPGLFMGCLGKSAQMPCTSGCPTPWRARRPSAP